MRILRRILNVITSVMLGLFSIVLLFNIQGNLPDQNIPISFSVLIAAFPGIAQIWNTFLSWEPAGRYPSSSSAVLGIAGSAINAYVLAVLCISVTLVDDHDGYFTWGWIAGGMTVVLFCLATTAINFLYFRQLLIEAERSET